MVTINSIVKKILFLSLVHFPFLQGGRILIRSVNEGELPFTFTEANNNQEVQKYPTSHFLLDEFVESPKHQQTVYKNLSKEDNPICTSTFLNTDSVKKIVKTNHPLFFCINSEKYLKETPFSILPLRKSFFFNKIVWGDIYFDFRFSPFQNDKCH